MFFSWFIFSKTHSESVLFLLMSVHCIEGRTINIFEKQNMYLLNIRGVMKNMRGGDDKYTWGDAKFSLQTLSPSKEYFEVSLKWVGSKAFQYLLVESNILFFCDLLISTLGAASCYLTQHKSTI